MEEDQSIRQAKEVLRLEAESILQLIDRVGEDFSRAVELIYRCTGRVIVAGIGKSGLIGRKVVATLTSTGTQALFLHPVEGLHGDLGIVTKDDVLVAISHSGETDELNMIVDSIRSIGVPRIAFTGNLSSTLARFCDIVIDVGVAKEACPFGLAPTSSSTAALAMGDALAVALIHRRNFQEKDFFKFHPGGSLGSRLRAKVRDVMIHGSRIPRVDIDATMLDAIREMDETNKGFVLVTDVTDKLLGILTDGDVRRLVRSGLDFRDQRIEPLMTHSPKSIRDNISVALTVETMQRMEITTLVVTDDENRIQGYVHLHDLLGRGGTLKMTLSE
ncbi:MAG: KpsF/GutQ family sugar-phosphate isomerase [Proteobacteria bacterium]|nr:KpsF/GutQ family sugar-phosphate isomerase [Pseudomonadota bacterium]MBU1965860.1 KpsF/GutQ family sugar-phosphate isomerase [Pseudomonadota bacterium]